MVDEINASFDRIDDFLAVQAGRPPHEQVDAVELLQAAVGIGDDERVAIRERLDALDQFDHAGGVVFGMIVALFAAEAGSPAAVR